MLQYSMCRRHRTGYRIGNISVNSMCRRHRTGYIIGNISINSTACVDDIVLDIE